jgi:hypothetical protein
LKSKLDDEKIASDLAKDGKECSENVMIVDLVRNDLSKSAIKGSVKVEELCKVYSFKQVHQMISTVVCEIDEKIAPIQVLKDTFPMGSMTGAPKVSAMTIIEKYENTKRGLYSGAVGYFTPNGNFDLVQKLLAKEYDKKCEVLYDRSSYGCDKKWVSKLKNDEYKYPCVYTINSKSELKLFYSNKNNGIGINKKKLIWSNGRIKSIGSFIDKDGIYGLTQFAYAIVDEEENLENIKKAFDSYNFRRLMEYCAVCQLTVNYKIIGLFKKDFWKEFINE